MKLTFTPEEIKEILKRHRPRTDDHQRGLRPAAVLAIFYPAPDGLSLIFTKRTERPDDQHSGQISFPGGMRELSDPNSEATALRETQEEIGVDPRDVEIWGRLNQEVTISGFSIAPFIGSIPFPYQFHLSAEEVERLIIVPFDHLFNPSFLQEEFLPWNGRQYKNYKFIYKNDVIWGATARMLHNFLSLLTTGREPEDPRFLYDH